MVIHAGGTQVQDGGLDRLGAHRLAALRRGSRIAVAEHFSGDLPSARTNGRVMAALDGDGLRRGLRDFYGRRKRNKSLPGFFAGWIALILDGHESAASFLQDESCGPVRTA